jgi:hypothetical protein
MRYSFFINLPCGAIAATSMALFFQVPKAVKPTEATLKEKILQMDIPGFLLVLASVVCYLLAMQWGGVVKSWGSAGVVGTLVGSVVLFVTFLAVEWYQGERALLLPSILKNRTIAHGCAFSFLYVVPIFTYFSRSVTSCYHRIDIHAFLALRDPFISSCITFLSISKRSEAPEQPNQGYGPFH